MADFSGVTFAKQNVTPADDGLIRRALLSDGILTGCNFSYSGYTLSMRAGALIVCGRQIRHPSAQNWAVVGAKSGYARLVLDIDLTKSSTKELFEQVSTTLEYATDEAGFTELIQEDLNVSGSHYQIALCVVSLGEAGITGIVSQLDSAAGTGGNFSVVGGLTQPASPKENMIWVKANVKKAPKYVFAVAAPESPSEGLIWFLVSSAGAITQASAYTDGTWVAADTYMYLAGNWVQITAAWNGELFDNGNQYEDVTGGWSVDNSYYGSGSIGTTIVGGSGGNNADQGSRIYTNKAVQSVAYQTFKFTVTEASGNNTFYLKSDSISGTKVAYHTFDRTVGTFSIAIPSGLASFYPYLQTGGKGKCKITKVWME